jgi:hypothetical protein
MVDILGVFGRSASCEETFRLLKFHLGILLMYFVGKNFSSRFILHRKYFSSEEMKKNEMRRDVPRMGEWRSVHRILFGKPVGKRLLVRHRLR